MEKTRSFNQNSYTKHELYSDRDQQKDLGQAAFSAIHTKARASEANGIELLSCGSNEADQWLRENAMPIENYNEKNRNLTKTLLSLKKENMDPDSMRSILYASKYQPSSDLSAQIKLDSFLSDAQRGRGSELSRKHGLKDDWVRTRAQGHEYEWVIIGDHNINKKVDYRFYIAPRPEKVPKVVEMMTKAFLDNETSVRFKYQRHESIYNDMCDRIIIYPNEDNLERVEDALTKMRQENSGLFDGAERSQAWLYNTKTSDVYFAPETPGKAYSEEFSDAMVEARTTLDYLLGITDKNPRVSVDANTAMKYMKLLIGSTMLRKGLLIDKGRRRITPDTYVKSTYFYDTGILRQFYLRDGNKTVKDFKPTKESREALLGKYFYSL